MTEYQNREKNYKHQSLGNRPLQTKGKHEQHQIESSSKRLGSWIKHVAVPLRDGENKAKQETLLRCEAETLSYVKNDQNKKKGNEDGEISEESKGMNPGNLKYG